MTPETIQNFKQATQAIRADLPFAAPEMTLALFALGILLADLVVSRRNSRHLAAAALLGMAFAGWYTMKAIPAEPHPIFSGMLLADAYGCFFKFLFLAATAVCILITWTSKALEGQRMGEYYCVLLCSVIGAFLMASAYDLLMFYVAVEMLSVPSYILTGFHRDDPKSSEASLKYVVYGAFASGAMLYGISLFYGYTGTTSLSAVTTLSAAAPTSYGLAVAVVLMFAGFAYKMSAVPMHFWTPDVYQGAPTPITAWLSVPSKAAGFALFMRFVFSLAPGTAIASGTADIRIDWYWVVAVVSAVTMTLGNLAAIRQESVKRMLGYSSIAHAGYLLMGVATLAADGYAGYRSVLFYLTVYLFMNLGAFAVVVLVQNLTGSEDVKAFRGLGRYQPVLAVCLTIFLISLIGIPPTGGFVGKLLLLAPVIKTPGMLWLAVFAVANTAVSAYYYLRIVKAMFLDDVEEFEPARAVPAPWSHQALALSLAAATLVLGIFFNGLNAVTLHLKPFIG